MFYSLPPHAALGNVDKCLKSTIVNGLFYIFRQFFDDYIHTLIVDKTAQKAMFQTEVDELKQEVEELKLKTAQLNKLNEEVEYSPESVEKETDAVLLPLSVGNPYFTNIGNFIVKPGKNNRSIFVKK